MDEFYQKQGKDWLRYTFTEDGVRKEESWNNNVHSDTFKFIKLGRLSGDYKYFDNHQRAIPPQQRRTVLIVAIAIAILCFGASGALAGPDNKTTAATVVLMVVGWTELLGTILFMHARTKKLRTKILMFEGDKETSFAFFVRNQQDEDQITSFAEQYEKAWLTWTRKDFTKAFDRGLEDGDVAKHTADYRAWLTALHERDELFSDEEYHAYLSRLESARKVARQNKEDEDTEE